MKDFPGRCVYVTPSRYAATAALRLRRCLATLHLRHPFALRCNGSAASSSVARYAAPTSPLRATLQRKRCVTSAVLQRCSALRRGWISIKEWIEGQLRDGMKPCRSNCVEATKDTKARTNSY